MLAVVPAVKVIVLLRNPVARALSEYTMLSRHGFGDQGFDAVARQTMGWLREEPLRTLVREASMQEHSQTRYVARGVYLWSLLPWWQQVPADQLLVLRAEDLFANPAEVTQSVQRFLGLVPRAPEDVAPRRAASEYVAVDTRVLDELAEFYEPWNRELYAMIGRDMEWENGIGAPRVPRAA